MRKKLITFGTALMLSLGLAACSSSSEKTETSGPAADGSSGYPESNITIVAPSGAGGGWDLTARAVSKVMSDTSQVEKPITVENRAGGGGAVFMAEYATKEAENDYMLMAKSPPILINNLKAEGNSPYGYKDTTPLAQLTRDYGAIVVKADSPFNKLTDLLEAIKKDPTSITMAGGSAPGSMDHLVGVLPAYGYGIDPKIVKYVSYDGGGEAIAALLGGNADAIATDASAIAEYVKSGDVKVLAVSSAERLSGELENVPTFQEEGVDAEFTIWRGLFGPKNMSEEAYEYWTTKLSEMVETEEWKSELERNGWQYEYRNAEEFTAFLEEQEAVISELLKALDMHK
ncbi:tripartite tricarboxylate transporter substrate binding protein [Lysinibacillus sp. BW-2-10]|uniref:tripartite tricarboxylate transporter substrate binding protein n=1 Tax=Lysinibacillus sp. BW-2-10 TaxID=2590030 RepID=UPI00117CA025|nr:tripartite tricarboxylate transporter substrate binding protein [Lysinibacillus sp. BW-2-10]TSI04161.1 tripartite tricarboxylate transporter substrate binding protein [Lysinibacillus sp. BW-2-10]